MATFDEIVPVPHALPTSRITSRLDIARVRQSILSRNSSWSEGPVPSLRASREASDSPRLTRTSWEADRASKRVSLLRRKPSSAKVPRAAQHGLKRFPREVYDGIVEQLKLLHQAEEEYCPSCYLKDLSSLSMTSRAWYRTASLQMYRSIWVPGHSHDASPQPGPRIPTTDRLKLLRRTLRARPGLAKLVRELHMPEIQAIYCNATIERESIANLVASLVMACPELERLVGFHVPYTHGFDRLSHALSTRTRLKERVWVMIDGIEEEEDGDDDDPTKKYYHAARDPTERFLELNSAHQGLATLVLHQEDARPKIDLTYRAIVGALWQFPFLRHLSLSGLTSASFSNLALNALPRHLHSLRLENLAGVNDKGLQRLASSHIFTSLRSLTLIDLEISQLATIASFLSSHLSSLERFSLSQHETPLLRSGSKTPVFQSQTLSYLHWELRSQSCPPPTPLTPLGAKHPPSWPLRNDDEPESCLATRVLAASISDGLFPALRRIRAPHDPQGQLQALCKPLAWASQSEKSERFYRPGLTRARSSQSSSLTTAKSLLAAQARIAAARKVPYLVVRVVDPQHNVQLESTMGRFLGDLQSNITYDLRPDREREGAGDADGVYAWMTGVDDIMGEWDGGGEGEEGEEGEEEGCGHGVGRRTRAGGVEVRELF